MRVELRLQTQNFGAVGRGGFVRIGGEGLDLVLAHGELYGLCSGLLGRGVRECVIFVLETNVVLLGGNITSRDLLLTFPSSRPFDRRSFSSRSSGPRSASHGGRLRDAHFEL